jgi:CheY-like chemotaxis protein
MGQNRATKADLLREIAALHDKLQNSEEKHTALQNQLNQALKMEAVGQLAEKIAHDFNNFLTTIIGYSELILSRMSTGDPFRMEINEILKVGERAAILTKQLLEINHGHPVQPQRTVLDSIEKEAQNAIHSDLETILLVEDENKACRLSRSLLKRFGYTVLEADGITEAIRICTEYSNPIHLLLTDIALLGMNGIELYGNLREIHTEMKVLFMSVHPREALAQYDMPEGTEFIQKPFNTDDLTNQVRNVLNQG